MKLLSEIDAHAARLAKRLANGLCWRRGGFVREAKSAALVESVFALLDAADTS